MRRSTNGENTARGFNDFRPEVHDSDGLLLAFKGGEWLWRPLDNNKTLSVSSLGAEDPVDAITYMDYVYQPDVQATIESYVNYICPVPAAKDVIAPEYRLKDDAVFWENGPNVDQETAEATKLLKTILAKRP